MVCFCFRSNKVSPASNGATELPDILAVPDAASNTQEAANTDHVPPVPENATNSQDISVLADVTATDTALVSASSEKASSVDQTASSVSESPVTSGELPTGENICEGAAGTGGSKNKVVSEQNDRSCDERTCSEECDNHACLSDLINNGGEADESSGNAASISSEKKVTETCSVDANPNSNGNLPDGNGKKPTLLTQPQPPSMQDNPSSTTVPDVTKRTFGRFHVYCSQNDVTKLDDVTTVRYPAPVPATDRRRPLVILIPWLNAKKRHVHKYSRLYTDKGMDVLLMPVTPLQVMRPLRVKTTARELLKLLQEKDGFLADRPLIVHGFSVGAFVWGQILVEMDKLLQKMANCSDNDDSNDSAATSDVKPDGDDASLSTVNISDDCDPKLESSDASSSKGSQSNKDSDSAHQQRPPPSGTTTSIRGSSSASPRSKKNISQRVLGVVMDSPAPVDAMLEGIPYSVSQRSGIRRTIRRLLALYFRLFPRSVTRHYIQGEEAVLTNAAKYPFLMLYSSADAIAPAARINAVVASWRERGVSVHVRQWEDSSHVDHFRPHKEQYEEALSLFLESVLAK